jgi:branched-chain amino acid transport system substrate-binding protein
MTRFLVVVFTLAFAGIFPAANGAAKEPIRIGTTQALTGNYGEFGKEQLQGLQMWVDDINARGALLGRPVQLVYHDDGSDPGRSRKLYGQMIDQQVDLLIGPYSSEVTLAASEVAEAHQFPMVTAAASAELIWERGFKNVFGIDTPAANYMDLAITEAVKEGAKRAALIYPQTDFSRDVARGVRREASSQGLNLVLDEEYAENQQEFGQLVEKLKAANVDVLLGATYLEDSVALMKQMRAAGVNIDMVAFTVGPALRDFGDLLGTQAEGVVGVVQWLRSVRMPKAQDFAYRYRHKYGYNPGVHATLGYSAGQVIEAAVRLAGSTDKDAVRKELTDMQFRSLLGHYQVDETGRQIGKRNYLLQWQDDNRRLVAPKELAERDLVYPLSGAGR